MPAAGKRLRLAIVAATLAAACSQAASSPEAAGPACPAQFYIEQDACVPLVIGDGSIAASEAGVDGEAGIDAGPMITEGGEAALHDAPAETAPAGCAFSLTPSSVHPSTLEAPSSIAIADLDRDGTLDMAMTAGSSGELVIFSGNGDGTFRQGTGYPAGMQPGAVVVGDLDRDGTPDIVVANSLGSDGGNGGTASVYLGSRDGGPLRGTQYPAGLDIVDMAMADFNFDAKPDVVFSTKVGTSVLLGNGDGTLQAPSTYGTGWEVGVVTGDMNGDGRPDIVTSQLNPYALVVQLGNGDGTFGSPIAHSLQGLQGLYSPGYVLCADVNHDGKMDVIASATGNGNQILVLFGQGDGSLADPAAYAIADTVLGVALGDMNGDGNVDVVASVNTSMNVLLGRSDGTFDAAITVGGVTNPTTLAIGDFNSDGKEDVVVADTGNLLTVLLGACMR
jgi:hypothetical protein